MSWLSAIFDPAPNADARIAAEEGTIAHCGKILAMRRPHPMAAFFATIRKAAAEARLRGLRAARDRRAENEKTRASLRPGHAMAAGSRYDPAAIAPRDNKPRPLGHSAPSLPAAARWQPRNPMSI
ncbi:hypothetical protein QO058_01550 [Bosea vestrisii]|uniref:hypothetical protein n=1 Tax=Bosea vestrisii TaxID=151416 RepID=UPI0024DF78CE|nr:hypothetical protein [Bosea vestrisii]WID96997.1 hypothetical protein QO058_01550 [Bosea vestrisii]